MSEFRFKRFSVVNERSAMKVNTDGVLLGALMTVSETDRFILDLGTGTGTIALMAAQRHSDLGDIGCRIFAVDIDSPSAEEAKANFEHSPWSSTLSSINISLSDFARLPLSLEPNKADDTVPEKFDHIFSNPPYFDSELRSPDARRREARHSESMSYREIVEFASVRLSGDGRLSLILPAEEETALCRYAAVYGLYLFRIVKISTVDSKPPRRIVAEFSLSRTLHPIVERLAINENGRYTDEYIRLTSDFYLFDQAK